jgi:co-chaperonin GroES (HSP10)
VSSSVVSRLRRNPPAASSSPNAKEKLSQGEVIAVGPGGRDDSGKLNPIDLRVGDRVLFGKWSGTEVKIDGEETHHHERVGHHGRAR